MTENTHDIYDELLDIAHAFSLDHVYVSEPATNPDGYRYQILIGKSNVILFKTPEAANKLSKLLGLQTRIVQEAAKNVEAITQRVSDYADLEAKYKRLEEALQLIADGKADEWVDSRPRYTRWMGFPGGIEIIRQTATLVLRDIDEPDEKGWLPKLRDESEA